MTRNFRGQHRNQRLVRIGQECARCDDIQYVLSDDPVSENKLIKARACWDHYSSEIPLQRVEGLGRRKN